MFILLFLFVFFFNDTATTEIYTLSLHDALPIEPLSQTVEPFRDGLTVGVGQRLRALVDLDPGDDPLRLEKLRERGPVRGRLPDRLVVEDDAADELLGAFGSEEQLAVGAAVLLCRLDPDRVESFLDRAVALVGGEDAFPLGDERLGGLFEVA